MVEILYDGIKTASEKDLTDLFLYDRYGWRCLITVLRAGDAKLNGSGCSSRMCSESLEHLVTVSATRGPGCGSG